MLGGAEEERGTSSPLHLELRGQSVLCPQRKEARQRGNPGPGLVPPLSPTPVLSASRSREGKTFNSERPRVTFLRKENRRVWNVSIQPVAWCSKQALLPTLASTPAELSLRLCPGKQCLYPSPRQDPLHSHTSCYCPCPIPMVLTLLHQSKGPLAPPQAETRTYTPATTR